MIIAQSTAIHAQRFQNVGSLLGSLEVGSEFWNFVFGVRQGAFQIDKDEITFFKERARVAKQSRKILRRKQGRGRDCGRYVPQKQCFHILLQKQISLFPLYHKIGREAISLPIFYFFSIFCVSVFASTQKGNNFHVQEIERPTSFGSIRQERNPTHHRIVIGRKNVLPQRCAEILFGNNFM